MSLKLYLWCAYRRNGHAGYKIKSVVMRAVFFSDALKFIKGTVPSFSIEDLEC
jgi:hypothetical protein